MNEQEAPTGKSAAEHPDLGVMSYKMSADAALRSWTNMTISMISFGFAIYKILQQNKVVGAFFQGANTPRNVGLFLIDAGTIGILMGIVSYVRTLRQLRPLRHFRLMQPALAMALLISVLGLVLSIRITASLFR
jgi:putative membrane protein